jgi:hypothetical protein
LRDEDFVLCQEFGHLLPVQTGRTVYQRGKRDGPRHLPFLRFVCRLWIGNNDIRLPGLSLFRNQDQRDLARPLFLSPQNGGIAHDVALAELIDGAKRKGLMAGMHAQIHSAERPTPRAIHERRRFGRRSGWIRLLCG